MTSANPEGLPSGKRQRAAAVAGWVLAFLALSTSLAGAAGFEALSSLWWGGIAGGIALALLTGSVILLNVRLRTRRERDLFASSLDTLPVARQIVAPDGSVMFASTVYRRMFPDADRPMKTVLEGQLAGEPAEADRLGQLEAPGRTGDRQPYRGHHSHGRRRDRVARRQRLAAPATAGLRRLGRRGHHPAPAGRGHHPARAGALRRPRRACAHRLLFGR